MKCHHRIHLYHYLILTFFLYFTSVATAQTVEWARKMGATATNDWGEELVCNATGDVYGCGAFFGSAQFGTYTLTSVSGSAAYVTKTNTSGNVLWAMRFSGTANVYPKSITCDEAGDVYVMGQFGGACSFGPYTLNSVSGSDCFIAKVNAAGTVLWAKQMGSATYPGMFFSVTSDHSGNLYATGYFQGTGIFGATTLTTTNYMNVFVLKMNTQTGTIAWAKQMGAGTMYATANTVVTDHAGNIYVGGIFQGSGTFDSQTLTSAGGEDIFIAKLEPVTGNVLWMKQWGSTSGDAVSCLATDATGNLYFTGSFYGTVAFGAFNLVASGNGDIVTGKINPSTGDIVWAKAWGGVNNFDSGESIQIDSKGNVYVCGYYVDQASFDQYTSGMMWGENIFIARVDAFSGAVVWVQQMGGAGNERASGLACDASGNIYMTGSFEYSATFGSFTLTPAGGMDAFLVKVHDVVTGLKEDAFAEALQIGPNPFTDVIHITSDEQMLTSCRFTVSDVLGKTMYETLNSYGNITLHLSTLSPGIYYLTAYGQHGERAVKKIIRE